MTEHLHSAGQSKFARPGLGPRALVALAGALALGATAAPVAAAGASTKPGAQPVLVAPLPALSSVGQKADAVLSWVP